MPLYQYFHVHHDSPWVASVEYEHVHVREGPPAQPPLCSCGEEMKRDWQGENVGVLREAPKAARHEILPTAKDFERPEDPTGQKGMARWLQTHEPRPGNKNPSWPTRSERQGV